VNFTPLTWLAKFVKLFPVDSSAFCDGTIRALTQVDGEVEAKRSLGISAGQLTSFAQDEDGELYTFNLAGEVRKIVPG